jgi:hypothetical protein
MNVVNKYLEEEKEKKEKIANIANIAPTAFKGIGEAMSAQ